MTNRLSTSAVALAATIFAASAAYAADLGNQGDPTSAAYSKSWTGPWAAAIAGYSIATITTDETDPVGVSIEGGFVQGEVGYDVQVSDRFVVGGFVCAAYSAIEGLADGYCVQTRGGVLLSPNSFFFGNIGWRWQGTDGEGDDSIYFSGPVAGLGIESRVADHASIKLSYEHQWITDVDGETVPDELNLNDNRVMTGIVFRY